MSDGEGDKLAIVTEMALSSSNEVAISDLLAAVGLTKRTADFNLGLHALCETYREKTGHHVREWRGKLVKLDRGVAQLQRGKRLGQAAIRKSKRAIDVVRKVDPENLEPTDKKSRERFLDREEGRMADAKRVIVSVTEEEVKLLEQENFRVKRIRRPR